MEYLILNEKVNLCWRLKAFRVNHAIALRCRWDVKSQDPVWQRNRRVNIGGGLILQTSLVFPSLTLHFSTSLSLPSYTDQAGNSISIVAFYKVTLRVLYAFGNPVASCYRAADDAEWYICYSRILSAYGMALTIVWPAPSWHRPTMLHDKVFLRAADSHTLVYICSWIFVNYWIRQKKNHCRLNLPWNALVERILIFFR